MLAYSGSAIWNVGRDFLIDEIRNGPELPMTVNGKPLPLSELEAPSIVSLLKKYSLSAAAVAIEKNGAVVPRDTWKLVVLQDEDRIEIIRFVGGG